MNNKRGLRANLLLYEDMADKERILMEAKQLFGNDADMIIQKAKQTAETTTVTFQEALNKEIEKLKK